ncbi:MAG: hypothetical protein GY862_06385 [Gammaproteobacteria bacterium]|nr:hypothetical protein [Gammaproteobacteria bacterium]
MKLTHLFRLCFFLAVTQMAGIANAAESLSPEGSALSAINIDPGNAVIAKQIDTKSVSVSETYVVVQLISGDLFQKTPAGFVPWDGQLIDNAYLADAGGVIDYPVASGDLSGLPFPTFPLTVHLGLKDDSGGLHYGSFQVTSVFEKVTDWDNTAVRKVLHAFAFGGFADDTQIETWAGMAPEQAIQEMLTFDTVNAKLSPPQGDGLDNTHGTLAELSEFWSASDPANPIHPEEQNGYNLDQADSAARIWWEAANRRGLNPVRQKIGFWETNYHMAVSQDVGVNDAQTVRYYDDIMAGLNAAPDSEEAGYQNVVSGAALSAAVATQYNHRNNTYEFGRFRGNEDFGREYHQLFFGILGNYNPDYHEEVTIKNTSMALTDMPVADGADEIVFGTEKHHADALEILNQSIEGTTAEEKINAASQIAIEHPESLTNLPIIIARGLGDEDLNAAKIKVLQNSWAAMTQKDLLQFLRDYAVSTIFHDSSRLKYNDGIHRHLYVTNQLTLSNEESYRNLYGLKFFEGVSIKKHTSANVRGAFSLYVEEVRAFSPMHDVFGGQTGMEASDDAEVFRAVYNRSTDGADQYNLTHYDESDETVWAKDWGSVAPAETDGAYSVKTVAEWLWNRFTADGLKNLGILERFHLYSLLANGTDPGYQLDQANAGRVFTTAELTEGDANADTVLLDAMANWSSTALSLGGADSETRRAANQNVGQAINFIAATPFIFAQEGK